MSFSPPSSCLLSVPMHTAGGGLSGDGENYAADGDSIWPSVWEGHSQRWPLGRLQRAAVGAKESGDGDSLGSSQLDSLLRSTRTVKGEKGRALTKICRFFIFLCLLWLVLGGKNGNKTRQRQSAVSPYLSCTKLKISLGIRFDLDFSCGLDVDHQVWPDLTGLRLRAPDQNMSLGHCSLSQSGSHNHGHEFELFGPNQSVLRDWTITAPAVLPAHQRPRQPELRL